MNDPRAEIARLHRERPRNRFLRITTAAFLALVAYSWLSGDIEVADLLSERRIANLERFVTEDIVPRYSFGGLLREKGIDASLSTLAISVLAIVLAGAAAALFCLPAARTFMRPEPFTPGPGSGDARGTRLVYGVALRGTRLFLLFVRSIPEFVWAYLFLAMLGPTAWPAVIALALHNAGTLGKLFSEVVENEDPETLRGLRALGAPRVRVALFGVLPLALPRFLLYFFYRWETCVREATILGMIGIVSLGYWIREARTARAYDEMLFFVILGALIVLTGDLVSALVRRLVRRAV